MVKYEIRECHVEMMKSDYARYGTAYEKFNCETDQKPDETYEYDTEEEARGRFDEMSVQCKLDQGYGPSELHFDYCEILFLVEVYYDYDDNNDDEDYHDYFLEEGGIDFKYADRTTMCVSDNEDEDEE